MSVYLKPMSFYDFWKICLLLFSKKSLNDAALSITKVSNICTKKFLPSVQIKEILQHPQRDGQMVKSLTDSLVNPEEGQRHQRNVNENEQLKKQIAEVSVRHKLWYNL